MASIQLVPEKREKADQGDYVVVRVHRKWAALLRRLMTLENGISQQIIFTPQAKSIFMTISELGKSEHCK